MDPIHLHLILNHIPVIGTAFCAALLAYGVVRGKGETTRVGLVALIVVAAITFVVARSGESAEDLTERIPGVTRSAIHPHEEAGEKALITGIIAGVLALAVLIVGRRKERMLRLGGVAVLIVTFVFLALAGYTANLGGHIRHTELRGVTMTGEPEQEQEHREGRDH